MIKDRIISIIIATLGIIPLAYLGLITPHVLTAELAGLGDMALVGTIGLSLLCLGDEWRQAH